MLVVCKMCGKYAEFKKNCTYQYDNGEQFTAAACEKCADLHAELVKL